MPLHYVEHRCKIRRTTYEGQAALEITGPCVVTGMPQRVVVTVHEMERYNDGELIQKAFARLTPDEREFLMSGHSAEGRKATFPGDKE